MDCRLLYLVGQLGLGGLERQLVSLIRSMDRERYKPVVAVWGNSPNDYYTQDLEALNVPVIRLGVAASSSLAKLWALWRLISTLRPQVIHSYTFYTNIAAWWVARGTVAIPIGSVRNNYERDRREAGMVLGRLCGRWPLGQIYNSFNAELRAERSKTIFRPRRIYVVMNGVDLNRFAPRPHPERGYILAVGSMYAKKRWDRLIRAVALLAAKGVCPEVVHAGTGPLRGELETMARNLHVDHLIRFLGTRHDLPALLGGAAFLAHSAEDEGCPNVVLEAMACGRAVVATDAGDIPELIADGETGFVVPRDNDAMFADRIAKLLENRDLCRRMGDFGRIKAEREFGLDRLVLETFAVYRAEGWAEE